MEDPTTFLTTPGEPDASISKGFANPLDMFNLVSPAAWINETIKVLTNVDVFGWLSSWLAGDWQAIWKFGDVLRNLGECLQQLGSNVQLGILQLDESWEGNACDAAFVYFSRMAAAISGQQVELYKLEDNYHQAAMGAWALAGQLGNIMQAMADKVILAGIAAAAATVISLPVGGVVLGYGLAALMAVDLLKEINKATSAITTSATVILGVKGAVQEIVERGGRLSAIPLPAAPYRFPES